jgi:hypothetical protein
VSLAWGDQLTGAIAGEHPNLAMIRSAITALYRRLPDEGIAAFSINLAPVFARLPTREDPSTGIEHIARAMLRHVGLPRAPIVVEFREHTGLPEVDLDLDYVVTLNPRHRTENQHVAAELAHAVTRLFLLRNGISAPDEHEHQVLTDTAAVYLGVGWPLLDAQFPVTATPPGYLTADEFGYVLGKRALAFDENIEGNLSSSQAKQAFRRGYELAREDWRHPPLNGCGLRPRFHYLQDRRRARRQPHRTNGDRPPFHGYHFHRDPELEVSFACPTCHHALRVPIQGTVTARCPLCRTVLPCET